MEHIKAYYPDEIAKPVNANDFVAQLEKEIFIYNEMLDCELYMSFWVEGDIDIIECTCTAFDGCPLCKYTGEVLINKQVEYCESTFYHNY